MSSTPPNRLNVADHPIAPTDQTEIPLVESGTPPISAEEADLLRKEKLEAVRKAIEAGDYDSDEVLAKAMSRMRDSIENHE